MSFFTSANPTVRRKEEAHLIRERLRQIDQKVERLARVWVAQAPAFTDAEIEEVGKLLVEGRIKVPVHARLTVTTSIEEVRHKLFNTTSDVIRHDADQLHTKLLRPMTVQEALEAGLIRRIDSSVRSERGWVWSEAAYERLASAN
jgi:hypothetical protein